MNSIVYISAYNISKEEFVNRLESLYKHMKDPDVIKDLQDTVYEIVNSTIEDGYKGLMLTPSFAVGKTLSEKIPKEVKVFIHEQGTKVDKWINEFENRYLNFEKIRVASL